MRNSLDDVKSCIIQARKDYELVISHCETGDELTKALTSWGEEVTHRLSALGYQATVDPFNVEVNDSEQTVLSPIIEIAAVQ